MEEDWIYGKKKRQEEFVHLIYQTNKSLSSLKYLSVNLVELVCLV
jgi:hypothetical protein